MGITERDEPTGPPVTQPPPQTVTVTQSAPPQTVTVTEKVTEKVTVTASPSLVHVTTTATPSPTMIPTPSPAPTITVFRTKTPKATAPPVVVTVPAPQAQSTVIPVPDERMTFTEIPNVAGPESSQPQVVVQIPPMQPVASNGDISVWVFVSLGLIAAAIGVLIWRVVKLTQATKRDGSS